MVSGSRRNGFTLVELLIVIIIIAVLAAIAIPKFANSTQRSKEASLRRNLQLIRNAEERCAADTGLVVDIADLTSSAEPAFGFVPGKIGSIWPKGSFPTNSWRGPYLQSIPINPITGNNLTNGGSAIGGFAWEFNPNQNFNTNYVLFDSSVGGLDGTRYRTW